jgi:hypothetical protein
MAINRPVTRTIISTTDWGVPITDEVNRLTTWQLAQVPTVWYNVVFSNGWSNLSGFVTQYRKLGDMVQVRGGIQSGAIGSIPFTMPVGFRPTSTLQFVQPSWAPTIAVTQFDPNGNVTVMQGDNRFIGTVASYSTTI